MCAAPVAAQTSSPTPTPRPGRSYSSEGIPKTPPPPGPKAPSSVTFTDFTTASKINFKYAASPTSQKYLLEAMGGGVAMFDYDNDGRMDLFFTNGALLKDPMPKGVMPDKTDPKFWNRLFHQKADGTFEDVTERAGLKGEGFSMGVAAGDYDNDGYVDLYVTGYGSNHLYHNNGDGTFTDVAKKLGLAGGGWSTSAGWFDYDRDGRLDLFVARYLDWDFETGAMICGDRVRAYCHPANFKGKENLLFHQRPDGSFEDVSVKAGVADPAGKALGVAFGDFDNDGWPDILVANDSVRQSLYHNLHDGRFEDIAVAAGAGYDENGKTFAGMGVDAADYDGDGWLDIFITTLSNETYPLYHNNGDLTFTWATTSSAIGQISLPYSGWGTHFLDVDNDGRRDIFVAQSHVLDTIEKSTGYLKYRQPPLLLRNLGGGRFTNVSETAGPAFNVPITARGAAFGDLNNDGQVDIAIGVLDGPPLILHNNGTTNHWLGIRLVGSKSNRDGIGARVTVADSSGRRQMFEVSTAGSYLSASDPRIIAGLGSANVQTVEIRWPSGIVQTLRPPAIDRYISVNEGDAKSAQ
jgi:enediyne biosynthesis protein E4